MTISEIKHKYGLTAEEAAEWDERPGYINCHNCPINTQSVSCLKLRNGVACDGYDIAWIAIQKFLDAKETNRAEKIFVKPKNDADTGGDDIEDFIKEPENIRRKTLREAERCVCTDREGQYGSPEQSFTNIAKLWSAYLGKHISAHDVAMLMVLFKTGRVKTGRFKADNYIDAAGYIACAAEIAEK